MGFGLVFGRGSPQNGGDPLVGCQPGFTIAFVDSVLSGSLSLSSPTSSSVWSGLLLSREFTLSLGVEIWLHG